MKFYEIEVKINSEKEIKYSSHEICKSVMDKFPIQQAIKIIEIMGEFIASDVVKKRIIWVIDHNIKQNYGNYEEINPDFEQFVTLICKNVIKKEADRAPKLSTILVDNYTKDF